MEGNGFVTGANLIAAGRREVETSAGKVLVGRLPYSALVEIRGGLLDLQSLIAERGGEHLQSPEFLATPEASRALGMVERVLCAAVIRPRLGTDPEKGPTPADFEHADQLALFSVALELCGFTKGAAEEVRP